MCDTSIPSPQPYVTQPFRQQVFRSLHGLTHLGGKATARLITQRYVWPRIKANCREWAKACNPYQRAKMHRQTHSPTGNSAAPSRRFQHIHMDIVGPLPSSRKYRYCLTIVDRFTRWPEAIPVSDITAETIARQLFHQWIARYGTPLRITTDRRQQFETEVFRDLNQLTGMMHWRRTAYHPAANGMVERFHRQLKTTIKYHQTEAWVDVLPVILMGIRAARKDDLRSTPAEMIYGEPIKLPGEFQHDEKAAWTQKPCEIVQSLR